MYKHRSDNRVKWVPNLRGGKHVKPINFAKLIATAAVLSFVISYCLKLFVLQPFYIPSGSMEPGLTVGDRVLVWKFTVGWKPETGDVVVFKDPSNWLPRSKKVKIAGITFKDGREHLIKRVVGVEGDIVECCDKSGSIKINDKSLKEEYVKGKSDQKDFRVVVPDGYVWVLGDNRGGSADSRYHTDDKHSGFVPVDSIVGPMIWEIPDIFKLIS